MKTLLKKKKNEYGYFVYKCPICKKWIRKIQKYSHFTHSARREALMKATKQIEKTPHLDFYLKNTKQVVNITRVWQIIL